MKMNHVEIDDTFAEGFRLYGARILITADSKEIAHTAALCATGFASSTIHCDCEAGIDYFLDPDSTPDHRPGVVVIFCVQGKDNLDAVLLNRIGQCILTCATTACFDWLPEDSITDKTIEVKTGFKLKFFGDGFEEKEELDWNGKAIPLWKIPVMDGYFRVQSTFKFTKIAAGGNFMVFSSSAKELITACQNAAIKMNEVEGVVLPFPGGFVRSPSKIGSKYNFLTASTNHTLIPELREKTLDSCVPEQATAGYEFVINGFSEERVCTAMKIGILELCNNTSVLKITAGNYGGKLGKLKFNLKEILSL
ncbi:MAG: formylmethanofuran--tetrahydromethanopterin N-formyltransferase [Promethearchaeota archaeon]|nr:MAG: formylmethanofuran--tetrahydromethanopterin N-formyltransferase [Candidatus Lokiarchaeota archaeon]